MSRPVIYYFDDWDTAYDFCRLIGQPIVAVVVDDDIETTGVIFPVGYHKITRMVYAGVKSRTGQPLYVE